MLRVYSGKFCGSIDERDGQFEWSVTLADVTLPDEQPSIATGHAATMETALIDTYRAMTGAIAGQGGHETEK